jgi:hypothetical protein
LLQAGGELGGVRPDRKERERESCCEKYCRNADVQTQEVVYTAVILWISFACSLETCGVDACGPLSNYGCFSPMKISV